MIVKYKYTKNPKSNDSTRDIKNTRYNIKSVKNDSVKFIKRKNTSSYKNITTFKNKFRSEI